MPDDQACSIVAATVSQCHISEATANFLCADTPVRDIPDPGHPSGMPQTQIPYDMIHCDGGVDEIRSLAPAYSDIARPFSPETVLHQEQVQEIERLRTRINDMANLLSNARDRAELENEVALLRSYVARLETQLYEPWIVSSDDDPPPEY